jgi:hypothetical protein
MTNKIKLNNLKVAEHLLEEKIVKIVKIVKSVKIVEIFFRLNIKGYLHDLDPGLVKVSAKSKPFTSDVFSY